MKRIKVVSLTSIILIATFVMLLSHCSQQLDTYYISQNGDDHNPGTINKPFRSLQKMNSMNLKAGDKVFLRGGEVFLGTLTLMQNGTLENPILISSYDNEKENAIIDGGNKEAIIVHGNHFQLNNLTVKGGGRKTGNTTSGISLIEASHGIVENIRAEGFQKSGIQLTSCGNIDLKNVYAVNNGFSGIYVIGTKEKRSRNILVKDCRAENNPGDPTILNNHSGNGILVGWSDTVLIDHCAATNNGWDMPWDGNGPVGIWAYESNNVIIQYCISYQNKTAKGAKDGGGFDFDGGITNSLIQYCLSYENDGAGYGLFQYGGASLWFNNVVRYCVSVNDAKSTAGAGGIFIWNGSQDSVQLADCDIYNNVVYSTHAPAVQFEPTSPHKNFSFFNNIFIGSGTIVNGPASGEKFLANVWWKTENNKHITFREYEDLLKWSVASGQEELDGEILGKQIDPLLLGPFHTTISDPYRLASLAGYQLSPQSPVKNSGIKPKNPKGIPISKTDFFGNIVPQGSSPEPGIHEIKE
jgi:Right handed beta helix region